MEMDRRTRREKHEGLFDCACVKGHAIERERERERDMTDEISRTYLNEIRTVTLLRYHFRMSILYSRLTLTYVGTSKLR